MKKTLLIVLGAAALACAAWLAVLLAPRAAPLEPLEPGPRIPLPPALRTLLQREDVGPEDLSTLLAIRRQGDHHSYEATAVIFAVLNARKEAQRAALIRTPRTSRKRPQLRSQGSSTDGPTAEEK
jgi:hypothetical protein